MNAVKSSSTAQMYILMNRDPAGRNGLRQIIQPTATKIVYNSNFVIAVKETIHGVAPDKAGATRNHSNLATQ